MISFLDIKFPNKIAMNAKIEIKFNTLISKSISNFELRAQNSETFETIYEISSRSLSTQEILLIKNFFINTKGCLFSFRFYDFMDNKAINEKCLYINKNTFQLQKSYIFNNHSFKKNITKINHIKKITLNNNLYTNFEIDLNAGLIKTQDDIDPNDILIADFEFDQEVRFLNDNLIFLYSNQKINIENIILKSIC